MASITSESALQDVRVALRGFATDQRFALTALTAIALAVGAATAVFSVVDRSLFRALPYHRGDRLVSLGIVAPVFKAGEIMFAGPYREWRSAQSVLDLTSWSGVSSCDLGGESPQRLSCARAEATFLPTLGVQPFLGRNFGADEDRQGAEAVALLSYGLWQGNFLGDRGVLGRLITLDGISTRVVGVLPPGFETPDLAPAELLIPQRLPQGPRTENYMVRVIGRLHPGATPQSAAASLVPLFHSFQDGFAATRLKGFEKTMELHLATLRDQQIREYRLALWMLLGSVMAFVLIACANVANLLLARSAGRRQEFAIRAALGATRGRLVRQRLTECGLLGLAGGAAGVGLAWCLLRVFISLAPDGTLRIQHAALDGRVLAFAIALSLGTAAAFGLAPSLARIRADVLGGARVAGRRRTWLHQALITAQLSVSMILLAGAGLFLVSLWRLQNAPLGFEEASIITASFTLPQYRYPDEVRQMDFFNQLEARLKELPGAAAVAISDSLPPGGETRTRPYVGLANPGGSATAPGMDGFVRWRYVTPGYFAALGIPIIRGRGFLSEDRQLGEDHVILNASLSRRLFGDGDPIGKRIRSVPPMVVVGIASDVRNAGLASMVNPELYVVRKASREGVAGSGDPTWSRRASAIIRSVISDRAAAEALRSTIQQIDPAVPVKLETMREQVDHFLARPRFQTALLSMFALTGLVLAGIGLYGLISFLVAERTREIGVRVALGARPRDIVRLVVSDAARWTAVGVTIGVAASAGLLRVLQGLLYGAQRMDVRIFGGAGLVLSFVAILAAWLPAHRAARIDPMDALRHD
jgi:putative ABC transport system permease protein